MENYEYIGCFLNKEELFEKVKYLRQSPLPNEKKRPHITFVYKPATVPEELFGQKITVTVSGYGNDGNNEGLQVSLIGNHPVIDEMISRIPVPHITLAVSDIGHAVNTRYLSFFPIAPFTLMGHFGGHIDKEDGGSVSNGKLESIAKD